MPLRRLSPMTYRKGSLRAGLRRDEGAALLEFAFSLGIFLMTTLGIVYLCMALFSYEYVDFAAREGVRWAMVRGSDCYLSSSMPGCDSSANESASQITQSQTDIQNYVKGLNYPIIDPTKLTNNINVAWLSETNVTDSSGNTYATWTACTPSSPPSGTVCNQPGNEVQVTVSYPISFTIPFFGNFTPTVSSTSRMVISQ